MLGVTETQYSPKDLNPVQKEMVGFLSASAKGLVGELLTYNDQELRRRKKTVRELRATDMYLDDPFSRILFYIGFKPDGEYNSRIVIDASKSLSSNDYWDVTPSQERMMEFLTRYSLHAECKIPKMVAELMSNRDIDQSIGLMREICLKAASECFLAFMNGVAMPGSVVFDIRQMEDSRTERRKRLETPETANFDFRTMLVMSDAGLLTGHRGTKLMEAIQDEAEYTVTIIENPNDYHGDPKEFLKITFRHSREAEEFQTLLNASGEGGGGGGAAKNNKRHRTKARFVIATE
jgi:hypothetical protein